MDYTRIKNISLDGDRRLVRRRKESVNEAYLGKGGKRHLGGFSQEVV